jgi:hypothetical protein
MASDFWFGSIVIFCSIWRLHVTQAIVTGSNSHLIPQTLNFLCVGLVVRDDEKRTPTPTPLL